MGYLYGSIHEDTLFVIGLGIELDEECDPVTLDHGIHYPTAVDICGFVTCSVSYFTPESLEAIKEVFVI